MFGFEYVILFILITKQSPVIIFSALKQRKCKSEWSLFGQNDATWKMIFRPYFPNWFLCFRVILKCIEFGQEIFGKCVSWVRVTWPLMGVHSILTTFCYRNYVYTGYTYHLEVLIHAHSHWILLRCLFVSLTVVSLTDRSMDQAGP